jgi:hypothetical protein
MSEIVLSVQSLPEMVFNFIPTKRVKVRQFNGEINISPFAENADDECPLLGLASDSRLTVEKFLEMTRQDNALEGTGS